MEPAAVARPVAALPAAPAAPAAAAPSQAQRQAEDTLRGRIRAAVEAAVRYPTVARMMGLVGKAGVSFGYRDGEVVGAVQIAHSAGAQVLDDAALAAVREAHYPKAPPDVGSHVLTLLVWVDFHPS